MINLINQTVQFKERTTVPKEQSDTPLFDILEEDVSSNEQYCRLLMNTLLAIPYARYLIFFRTTANSFQTPSSG